MTRHDSNSVEKIASLRFYDYPALSSSIDAWWIGLAKAFSNQGIENVPQRLCRDGHPNDALRSPRLLFGQTCDCPLTHELKNYVRPVATPEYDTPDTDGPFYRSLILARKGLGVTDLSELHGTRVAVNSLRSFSGFIALKAAFVSFQTDRPFFRSVLETGTHLGSLIALSDGDTDVCACDCVSYHLISRLESSLTKNVSVVGYGPWAPGLPFVTHANVANDVVERLQIGVFQALDDTSLSEARSKLLLCGASALSIRDYAPIVELVRYLNKKKAGLLFPKDSQNFQENWA